MHAVRKCVAAGEIHKVSPDALMWRDFDIGGDNLWDFSVSILDALNCDWQDLDNGFDADNYLPINTEIGWFGRLRAKRHIPDLTFREYYSFVRDGFVER